MSRKWMFLVVLLAGSFSVLAQSSPVQGSDKERNRAFKIDPFSPFKGKLTFGYEQAVVDQLTIDADLGIIGPDPFGNDQGDSKGFYVKAGPRFYTNPDFFTDDLKRFSDFQGFYFQPTLGYAQFEYTPLLEGIVSETAERETQQTASILLNLGRQFAFGDMVVLDLMGGIGYGFGAQDERIKNYSHTGNNFIASFTLSLGILSK